MRKCVYCSSEILDKRAMQICDRCGEQVWGRKMFDAIKKSTDDAQEKGDLDFNSGECLENKSSAGKR
jgi:hypothetical protein